MASLFNKPDKDRSLYSEQVETDIWAACHAFILHVHACGRLSRLCVSSDVFFLCFPFRGDFGQELLSNACHAFAISGTNSEHCDRTDFKILRGFIKFVQSTVNGL